MVTQMVLLESAEDAAPHRKMVNRVMNGVVAEIPSDEAGPDCWRRGSKEKNEHAIKNDRQWNAHHGRHDQPFGVVRVIVVNAVDDEMELLSNFAVRFVVKRVAMNDVLQQRPDGEADAKPEGNGQDRQLLDSKIEAGSDQRHVQDQRCRRMNPRKEIDEIAPEQANAFVPRRFVSTLRHRASN